MSTNVTVKPFGDLLTEIKEVIEAVKAALADGRLTFAEILTILKEVLDVVKELFLAVFEYVTNLLEKIFGKIAPAPA